MIERTPCINEHGRPKLRWDTQGLAHAQVERISRMNLDGRVREYQCRDCGFWHVGHARKGKA